MICFRCKAQLDDGTLFCTECGAKQPASPPVSYSDKTMAVPFAASHETDMDATQVIDGCQSMLSTERSADYPQQGYQTNQPDYGYMPPVAPPPVSLSQPPKKKGKGAVIAIICTAVVMVIILCTVIAGFLIKSLFFSDKKGNGEGTTAAAVTTEESTTKPNAEITLPAITAPQVTAPDIFDVTGGFAVPTVPHGDDTVNIGDLFGTTRPATVEPTAPPVDNSDGVPVEDYYDYREEPYAIADAYADQVHIGVYIYEEGEPYYCELGFFYKGDNFCLFMETEYEGVVIETDESTGRLSAYLDEGDGYYKVDTTQSKCEEVEDYIIYHLVNLGFDKDYFYPELTYGYLGDETSDYFGTVEVYDVYDNGTLINTIIVDKDTGYYVAVFDQYENYVYVLDDVDLTGNYVPYNFR